MELIIEAVDENQQINVVFDESLLPTQVGGGSLEKGDELVFTLPITFDGKGDITTTFINKEAYDAHLKIHQNDAALKTETDDNGVITMHRPFNRMVGANGTQLALGTLGSFASRGHLLGKETEGDKVEAFKGCLKLKGGVQAVAAQLYGTLPEGAKQFTLVVKAKANTKKTGQRPYAQNITGLVLK